MRLLSFVCGALCSLYVCCGAFAQNNPIVFVSQVPQPEDFATVLSTFANHEADPQSVPRGGDLLIRYPNGTLKNVTKEAGYGEEGQQGARSIAVRDPSVHWDGNRVIFSMVVGSPTEGEQVAYRWQLYEARNLSPGATPVISQVENQPPYNNVMPVYDSQDNIIFVSDAPVAGLSHTYPQLDEYESTPTNSGLWKLDPSSGGLQHLDHAPSGDFHPLVDSAGRVVFTRWDHLQQDQQADLGGNPFGAVNYQSESNGSSSSGSFSEVFPEPREGIRQIDKKVNGHQMNVFFPWSINQDGTEMETLNHLGRHELLDFLPRSFNDDGALEDFVAGQSGRSNPRSIVNLFHLEEAPHSSGLFYAVNAPEFGTHSAGQIVRFSSPVGGSAEQVVVEYVTHPATSSPGNFGSGGHSGFYRDPLVSTDGSVYAAHADTGVVDTNDGGRANPTTKYNFRLRKLVSAGGYHSAGEYLTPGINKSVSYFDPDVLVSYSGPLWELQPVELVARTRPPFTAEALSAVDRALFEEVGVSPSLVQQYLRETGQALLVTRNVTARDDLDRQQPFNLAVSGGGASTSGGSGKLYEVSELQLYVGQMIRGYTQFVPGRRVLPRPLESIGGWSVGGIRQGAVKVSADGSVAALVPAARALSWQLSSPDGSAVVRERVWVSMAAGEIRVCSSCHGVNALDQSGSPESIGAPEALRNFLISWRDNPGSTSGGGGVDDGNKASRPRVKLKLGTLVSSGRRDRILSELRAETPSVMKVRALNDEAKRKRIKIKAQIGSFTCKGAVKKFRLRSNGAITRSGSVPSFGLSTTPVILEAFLGGEIVGREKLRFVDELSSERDLEKGEAREVCRAIRAFG